MEILAYILRCIFMYFVTWAGVRLIGRKSIANMTTYDLTAIMLLTHIAAEPLVFKVVSTSTIGITTIALLAMIIGIISLKAYFYHVDAEPLVLVVNGKVDKKKLNKAKINVPLLMSELRLKGYQDLKDVAFAILEPSGKLSVIPTNQSRPVQVSDMSLPLSQNKLSFPIIVDGKLKERNLQYSKKDINWLNDQLLTYNIANIDEILYAQIDSKGNLYIDLKEKEINLPQIF